MSTRLKSLVVLAGLSLFCAPALFAAATGTASGTLKVNGKAAEMKYTYAYRKPSLQGGTDVVMIMSDQALPADVLKDEDKLRDLSEKGKFNGVRLTVHQDRRIMSSTVFSKALTGYISTALYVDWNSKHFGADGIDARVFTPGGEKSDFGQRWSYDIKFKTPGIDK